MKNDLFNFDVPELSNPHDRIDIICNLEMIAMCAFYIAGEDQMGLEEEVECWLDSSIEDYEPKKVYKECYDDLLEIIEGYNFFLNENKLSRPLIQLLIDENRTSLLKNNNDYPIYQVVLCNEQE